jgi:hypothetical protein
MSTPYMEPPTHEEIERRAYQMFLERGFQPGNELAGWLAAEKELMELWEGGQAYRYSEKGVSVLQKHATA